MLALLYNASARWKRDTGLPDKNATQSIKTLLDLAQGHLAAHRLLSARALAEELSLRAPNSRDVQRLMQKIGQRLTGAGVPSDFSGRAPSTSMPPHRDDDGLLDAVRAAQAKGDKRGEEAAWRAVLDQTPDRPDALSALANLLQQSDRQAEAAVWFRRAHQLAPDHPQLAYNLGVALQKLGDIDGAFDAYGQAVALKPDWPELFYNLGTLAQKARREEEALRFYRQALALRPDYAPALNNMGNILRDHGDIAGALQAADACLAADPNHETAQFNRGLTHMLAGDYAKGFADYATRYRSGKVRRLGGFRDRDIPFWKGQSLGGKKLLVMAEQGVGDSLQFCRFLPMLRAQGAQVILEEHRAACELISRSDLADQVIPRQSEPVAIDADYQAYAMDLPGLLGIEPATIPANVPYLHPDPQRLDFWRQKLAGDTRPKLGLVWAGNPRNKANVWRSVPFDLLRPLIRQDDIAVISLQKQTDIDVTAAGLTDWSRHFDTYDDSAALIAQLDLVIGICTSVTHLAGALGVPTWVMLHHAPDWRWGLSGETSPWYPHHRLFRQDQRGDWAPVIADVHRALMHWRAPADWRAR